MRAKPKPKLAGRRSFAPLEADRTRRTSSPSRSSSPKDSRRAAGSPRATLASQLKDAFRAFDEEKTGTINRADLLDVLLRLDPSLAPGECDRFLQVADKKGDGIIDYKAFVDLIIYVESPSAEAPVANFTADTVNPASGNAVNVFASMPAIAKQQGVDALPSAVENITLDELLEIQKLYRPPAVVQRVLEATCMLLDAKRSPRPRLLGWDAVRKRIAEDGFLEDMVAFDCADLVVNPGLVRFVITNYFKPKDQEVLTFSRVQYANQAAANLWKWCGVMVLQASKELEPSNGAPELDPPKEPTPPPTPKEPTPPTPKEPTPPATPKEPTPPPTPKEPTPPPTPKEPTPPPTPRPPSPTPSEVELAMLPLNDAERWHLEFRQSAGMCPDGWPHDSDCVVCFIYAHFQFRRDAGVCPEGFDRDEQCKTCSMFVGLNKMFNGVQIKGLDNVREAM